MKRTIDVLAAFLMLYVVFMLFALPLIVGWLFARAGFDAATGRKVSSEGRKEGP